jgi:hypothetical protein
MASNRERTGIDSIGNALRDRNGFTRQQRLIEFQRGSTHQLTVSDDSISFAENDQITGNDLST